MLSHDTLGVVTRFWQENYNQVRLDAVDELLAEDFALRDLGAGTTFDSYKMKKLVTDIHEMIQDFTVAVDEQHEAAGDRVVSRLTFRARKPDTGPEHEVPAVILTYQGIAISLVPGDRIRRVDLLWESTRAEVELEPADDWRWPPWKNF